MHVDHTTKKPQSAVGSLEISMIQENRYLWGRRLHPKHQVYCTEVLRVLLGVFFSLKEEMYTTWFCFQLLNFRQELPSSFSSLFSRKKVGTVTPLYNKRKTRTIKVLRRRYSPANVWVASLYLRSLVLILFYLPPDNAYSSACSNHTFHI